MEDLVVCFDFTIDQVITHKKCWVLAFLDLKKAFDRVPHALIFRVLPEYYEVDVNVIEVL